MASLSAVVLPELHRELKFRGAFDCPVVVASPWVERGPNSRRNRNDHQIVVNRRHEMKWNGIHLLGRAPEVCLAAPRAAGGAGRHRA
jgi:hypothetical protein